MCVLWNKSQLAKQMKAVNPLELLAAVVWSHLQRKGDFPAWEMAHKTDHSLRNLYQVRASSFQGVSQYLKCLNWAKQSRNRHLQLIFIPLIYSRCHSPGYHILLNSPFRKNLLEEEVSVKLTRLRAKQRDLKVQLGLSKSTCPNRSATSRRQVKQWNNTRRK